MSQNTWVHRAVRPMVKLLARTSISPNQVTTARLCFGLAAAAVAAIGPEPWFVIGAGLFVVSFLLDRADGALARMTNKSSPSGHRYDSLADVACNGAIFFGIGIALRDGPLGWWMAALGAFVGVAMVTGLLIDLPLKAAGSAAAEIEVAGFDLDDAMLIPPLAMWTGWTAPLLYAAAIGAPLFALFLAWKLRQIRRPRAGAGTRQPP